MGKRFVQTGYTFSASWAQFPIQPPATHHGRDDAVPSSFDATLARHGPGTSQDDALHAADFSGVLVQLFGWLDPVLDSAEPPKHRADEVNPGDHAARDSSSRSSLDAAFEKEEIKRRRIGVSEA